MSSNDKGNNWIEAVIFFTAVHNAAQMSLFKIYIQYTLEFLSEKICSFKMNLINDFMLANFPILNCFQENNQRV